MENVIALPPQLFCDNKDVQQLSGLFPEIGYYWFVKGNQLHLWNYNRQHDLEIPSTLNQQITHVLLSVVSPDVFESSVTVSFPFLLFLMDSIC